MKKIENNLFIKLDFEDRVILKKHSLKALESLIKMQTYFEDGKDIHREKKFIISDMKEGVRDLKDIFLKFQDFMPQASKKEKVKVKKIKKKKKKERVKKEEKIIKKSRKLSLIKELEEVREKLRVLENL